MKLSGNKKNGRYVAKGSRKKALQTADIAAQNQSRSSVAISRGQNDMGDDQIPAADVPKRKKPRHPARIAATVVLILLALAAALFCVYKLSVKPPPMVAKQPKNDTNTTAAAEATGSSPVASADRKGNQWTFVVLGFDDGNGNTDTIMVANFDADNHKLSVVNIPRDTLVNVKWTVKKANTLYSSGGGIDGVVNGLSDILGFQVDFYVIVDLKAFSTIVDAVDGVDFDVPVNMDYDDPAQNLHIHLDKGLQHLDGATALKVVRCRSVYSTADIGRIGTQQAFLKAAAEQILQKQDQLDITELAKIFLSDVKTDLDLGSLVWLGKEFYKMDSENITFTTLPANYWDTVNGTSYVTIYVDEWLKLLNESINPYKEDVTESELSILTRDANGKLYSTNGVYAGKQSWGSSGSSSSGSSASSSPSAKPSASPSSSPSTEPSPSPSKDTSPSPSATETSAEPSPSDTGSSESPSTEPSTSPSSDASPSAT